MREKTFLFVITYMYTYSSVLPRDGGDWWAAIYGIAQSRTQLKLLNSSIYMMLLNCGVGEDS